MQRHNLQELPGPAARHVTVAMAISDYMARRFTWPISGDHTQRARAKRASLYQAIPLDDYIHLATRRNVC